MSVAYLIPEWPSQTHIWMWREITRLRSDGCNLMIVSTRRPKEADRARHQFAEEAERETEYLWPASLREMAESVGWALLTRPVGLLRCIWMALTLPVTTRPGWRHLLPLVVPACILARFMKRKGLKHLHSQSAKACAILCMMVRRLGIGSYSVVVNANLDWWGGAMAEKLGEAAFVVVHARWIGEDILRRYSRVSAGHLVYAPVGVETAKWTMTTVGGVRHDSTFRIVSVGRLHPSKGHDVLIRAVAELRAAGMSVELRIIGSGPAEHELCRVIGEHDLQEYVMLLGSRSEDDVMAELRNASAFALASHAEPLGVVYMEAMALGLPVVGTAAGGVGEIITPGETGLLVPPNDVSAMAEAIRMLCSDRALCERLGAAARASIVTHYDAAIGAQRLRNVLQSVTTE